MAHFCVPERLLVKHPHVPKEKLELSVLIINVYELVNLLCRK